MPTIKQRRAAEKLVGNGGNVTQAMISAGYSKETANTPQKLTDSEGFKELMGKVLNDDLLIKKHKELLESSHVDHMVFPTKLTDEEITEILAGVNCVPKKFIHSDTATHVWFFAADNKARKDGLDMAYKIFGAYAPEKHQSLNVNIDGGATMSEEVIEMAKEELKKRKTQ